MHMVGRRVLGRRIRLVGTGVQIVNHANYRHEQSVHHGVARGVDLPRRMHGPLRIDAT